MPSRYLEAVREPGQTVNPLFAFLGVTCREASPERAVLTLACRPEFIQGGGVVAGGILAALADEAMAHVVLANLEEGGRTATVEMSVRYFRPVVSGVLTAEAVLVNKGRRLLSVQAMVYGPDSRLTAKAEGSFYVIDSRRSPEAG